jgi:hypothetical protein
MHALKRMCIINSKAIISLPCSWNPKPITANNSSTSPLELLSNNSKLPLLLLNMQVLIFCQLNLRNVVGNAIIQPHSILIANMF